VSVVATDPDACVATVHEILSEARSGLADDR
jgi:hypothetical protein